MPNSTDIPANWDIVLFRSLANREDSTQTKRASATTGSMSFAAANMARQELRRARRAGTGNAVSEPAGAFSVLRCCQP